MVVPHVGSPRGERAVKSLTHPRLGSLDALGRFKVDTSSVCDEGQAAMGASKGGRRVTWEAMAGISPT